MKKTYIKPETTAVVLNVCNNLLQASNAELDNKQSIKFSSDFGGREVIQAPDAWEMWE